MTKYRSWGPAFVLSKTDDRIVQVAFADVYDLKNWESQGIAKLMRSIDVFIIKDDLQRYRNSEEIFA